MLAIVESEHYFDTSAVSGSVGAILVYYLELYRYIDMQSQVSS